MPSPPATHATATATDGAQLLGLVRGPRLPGIPSAPAALAADAAGADRARELLGPAGTVLARTPDVPGAAWVEGDPGAAGEEVALGDELFVQVEGYASAAFVPLAGPTLLRTEDPEDLQALLADLDAAAAGERPALLADPVVQLADRCGLGGPGCGGPAQRLVLHAGGHAGTALHGPALGEAGATAAELQARWREEGCVRTCGAPATGEDRQAARATRPWLGRLLAALDLELVVAARLNAPVVAAGFAGDPGDLERRDRGAGAAGWPLLLRDGAGGGVLATADGGRQLRLGRDAAILVDAVLATGGEDAARRAMAALDVSAAAAAGALGELSAALERAGVVLPGCAA